MRITVFHPSDESYGADRVLVTRLTDLMEAGHEVDVFLPTDVSFEGHPVCDAIAALGGTARHIDMPVLRREYLRPLRIWILLMRLLRSSRLVLKVSRNSDLVYLNTSATLLIAPIVALTRRRPILHLHEYWRPNEATVLNALARFCSRIIAVSNAIVVPLTATNRSKVIVIYNGLPDRPSSPSSRKTVRTLLMASRWNEWKGHRTLAAAWRRDIPGWNLVILGGPPPSGTSVDVRELFSEADNVRIVGEVGDTSPFVDAADVIVVPSDLPDPLPTIALEALRAGKPVLGTSHGGLPEIIGAEAGWLFPPRDASALRERVVSLSENDIMLRSTSARRRFLMLFEESANATSYRKEIESLSIRDD